METRFTDKQGQYLSFIYYYTKLNGRAPAEADMERYFAVTPPSVHQMVLTLESKGLIERTPGLGRSIRLRIAREEFGPLAPMVFHEWGVSTTEDIGAIVFELVGAGQLSARPEDVPEDFVTGIDLPAALAAPPEAKAPRFRDA